MLIRWWDDIKEHYGPTNEHDPEDALDTPEFNWELLRYQLTLKYGSPYCSGTTRIVWDTGNGFIVKLSYPDKHPANEYEFGEPYIFRSNMRLVWVGPFPVLIMEKAERLLSYDETQQIDVPGFRHPDLNILDMPFDCELGYTKHGKLIGFDYISPYVV